MTKHNNTINKILKYPNRHIFISASDDGAIKCFYGRRIDYNI
jgi:hypothetical protein